LVWADAPNSDPGVVPYISVGRIAVTGGSYYYNFRSDYSSWPDPISLTTQTGYILCMNAFLHAESSPIPTGGEAGAKWCLMSLPVPSDDVDVDDLHFVNLSHNYTFSEAVANNVVMEDFYGWDVVGQRFVISTDFDSYYGYWMYLYKGDYSLWVATDGGVEVDNTGNYFMLSIIVGVGIVFLYPMFFKNDFD
jgi:hypothetical protein